jgi:hypothetical protein
MLDDEIWGGEQTPHSLQAIRMADMATHHSGVACQCRRVLVGKHSSGRYHNVPQFNQEAGMLMLGDGLCGWAQLGDALHISHGRKHATWQHDLQARCGGMHGSVEDWVHTHTWTALQVRTTLRQCRH